MSDAANQWRIVRLGDFAKTSSGGTPKRGNAAYYQGDIPWVKSGELGDSTVYETAEKISREALAASSAKLFPRGTLCVALYGATVGKLGILGIDAATNQAVCGIFLPEEIDTRFAYRFLESKRRELVELGKGGAQSNISQEIIRDLRFPLAPLPEQRRIVAEIEKQFTRLEAGVAALQRVQANLKRYRAAVLKAACEGRLVPTKGDWKATTLRDVLVGIETGKSFKCEERPPTGSEVGVVKVSAVTWGTYDELESKTCLDPHRIEDRYLVSVNDFLFSRANTIELIGACVIARKVTLRVMLSDKILRFRFSSTVEPRWVLYWLRSEFGRSEIERLATGNQESMRNIGQDRIRQIATKIPPLAEQTRIVVEVERRLSVVEGIEATVEANLKRAARLRQSVLQKAFTGELVS
jgi:type I restriction enzyme S subunit